MQQQPPGTVLNKYAILCLPFVIFLISLAARQSVDARRCRRLRCRRNFYNSEELLNNNNNNKPKVAFHQHITSSIFPYRCNSQRARLLYGNLCSAASCRCPLVPPHAVSKNIENLFACENNLFDISTSSADARARNSTRTTTTAHIKH